MDEAAKLVTEVGRDHGFAAMLTVGLLLAILVAGGLMIRTYLKLSDRLATAQEDAYKQHVQFARETGEATKQMAASTQTIEKAISAMLEASATRQHALDDIQRTSAQVHRAAHDLVSVAAEHLERTEPQIALILRRIADGLSKE